MIIEDLQSMLHNRFSDSRVKLRCYVNEVNPREMKCILLYYTGVNNFITTKLAQYYNQGVQIAVRHTDYDKGREIIFEIMEYIQSVRKVSNVYYRLDTVPDYLGGDERKGGHVWAFTIILQGGK